MDKITQNSLLYEQEGEGLGLRNMLISPSNPQERNTFMIHEMCKCSRRSQDPGNAAAQCRLGRSGPGLGYVGRPREGAWEWQLLEAKPDPPASPRAAESTGQDPSSSLYFYLLNGPNLSLGTNSSSKPKQQKGTKLHLETPSGKPRKHFFFHTSETRPNRG